MHCVFLVICLSLTVASCSAGLCGPYIFWGHPSVAKLQPRALVEANEQQLTNLFQDAKAIVVFVRNSTGSLASKSYPQFEQLVKRNAWSYLPQHFLAVEPFNYNANIEVINLSGTTSDVDAALVSGYNDAVTIYGDDQVLGILANHDDDNHLIAKRDIKENTKEIVEDVGSATTTLPTPIADEDDQSFIYVADGKKAILYVTKAPRITIAGKLNDTQLVEHKKAITFDDQRSKGYGRLNIIFSAEGEKLFLRFNFTLIRGTWSMKAVEVEYMEYKSVLPILGIQHNIPSAPVGFSYRCSSRDIQFSNSNDSLILSDYQVQPWLNGATKFGDVYDCIGFTTAPIWTGVLVSLFLCGILSIGVLALMDIKTPNRFESSRSKELSFFTQE